MSKSLEKLKDMLCDEIDSIAEKGELTAGSLDTVDKLTHSLKSIETILAMKDGGYSNDAYSRRSYRPYLHDGYYSRTGEREHMVERLRDMMQDASTEKERNVLKKCISELEV